MKFLVGMIIGLLLGAALTVSAQWSYVGVYTTQDLARSHPSYAGVYAIGVHDSLVAQQFHLWGGGAGQAHLNRAIPCLRDLVYRADLPKHMQALMARTSGRNAAIAIIDHACNK